MKTKILFIAILGVFTNVFSQEEITSPNNHIKIEIEHDNELYLKVYLNNEELIEKVNPKMEFTGGKSFGAGDKLKNLSTKTVDEEIEAVVPVKSKLIRDHYNLLKMSFKNYDFEVRVYNNGWAYRFVSKLKGEIEVLDEQMNLQLGKDYTCYLPEEESLISHFENYYEKLPTSAIENGTIAALPTLFTNEKGISFSVTESNLYDYPNLFLEKTENGFKSKFPKYVLKTKELKPGQDRLEAIEEAAPFIAKTKGKREFPWRVFMIAENDKEIIENNLVYQLASPLKLKDPSWIKPGKVAWDWWNANNVYNVDFESGINTETYKYYIDFASEFGLEYIILDEGWSKSTLNVMEPNEDIDMEELTTYAEAKNVGIILWSLWRPLDENMEALLSKYEAWGIKGVKVDFIQRADQYVTNFYERLAKSAADHHLLVDYHGGMKPSGMRRAYPNIINYEAVKGLENDKWEDLITPEHDLTIPFTRMTAGILDYTPGGMDNAHKENFAVRFDRPMTLGTRAHQIALYTIFEAPLQMLADTPSSYYENRESAEFISKIPVVWEETKVLDAKIGDYLIIARKNGDSWYVGAITDDSARTFEIDLSFLDDNTNYQLDWIEDGKNSDKVAKDYAKKSAKLTSEDKIEIKMNKGGGWIGIFTR
ncbi:glycoside hydrolase family 97 protein [Zunongwangia atlantica]|uniref:Putative alpha-glucosidase n=1 Tax=Zunongwangia atlantica 22II14-10F7 TaxID=1185767 RepID=A0A1Y1SYP7_9FLAO|nr:glycoside hydrolase family 97 protein [Zunongwangia atlantica]ORL43870.1 putative alpha-glucosidase [Zunongwangia atlantica 22II14-10F7]